MWKQKWALTEQVVVWISFIFESQTAVTDVVQVFQPFKVGYCYTTSIQVKILHRKKKYFELWPCDIDSVVMFCKSKQYNVQGTTLNCSTEDNPVLTLTGQHPLLQFRVYFYWFKIGLDFRTHQVQVFLTNYLLLF